MIKYLANHIDDFDSVIFPLMIALMKSMSAMLTEIINMGLLCGQNTIIDSVINFVALGAIA